MNMMHLLAGPAKKDSKADKKAAALTEAQEKASMTLYEETFAGSITPARIEELIKQGAKVDFQDGGGLSALDQALLTDNKPAAECLKKHKAQVTEMGILAAATILMGSKPYERNKAIEIISSFKSHGKALAKEEIKGFKEMYAATMQKCYGESLIPAELKEKNPANIEMLEKALKQGICEKKSEVRMLLIACNEFDKTA